MFPFLNLSIVVNEACVCFKHQSFDEKEKGSMINTLRHLLFSPVHT